MSDRSSQLFWMHLLKSKKKLKSGSTYFAQIELMCGNALLLAVAFDSLNVDSSAFLQRMKGCFAKQNKITCRRKTILLVPWLHILKHCYQQEFACKHTKILLVDILVPVFRPHFTVCNPLSNINIGHVCKGSADGLHLVQSTDNL